MRISYRKHLRLAQAGRIPGISNEWSPHQAALYGALASRYRALGPPRHEVDLFTDLAPFFLMNEAESVEALAEYAALQECPQGANIPWLKKKMSEALGSLAIAEQIGSRESPLFAPLFGVSAAWWNLLDEQQRLAIAELYNEWREVFAAKDEKAAKDAEKPDDLDNVAVTLFSLEPVMVTTDIHDLAAISTFMTISAMKDKMQPVERELARIIHKFSSGMGKYRGMWFGESRWGV